MSELIADREMAWITAMTAAFRRAPYQINRLHESDAELLIIPGSDDLLAATTDALVEEIANGLYDDPWMMGWMLATANFSDLAAVGARPLGLLIVLTLPNNTTTEFITRIGEGISDACRRAGSFVIGGDTNAGDHACLVGAALGTVPRDQVMRRVGCAAGDKIYLSGKAGAGNAFAFHRLQNNHVDTSFYRPTARISEALALRGVASACMDTSDGVLATLDTLSNLNSCRMVLSEEWSNILCREALMISNTSGLPDWIVLAGCHGEYELCFTIPADKEARFLHSASEVNWQPVRIGEVAEGNGVAIGKQSQSIDMAQLRSLNTISGTSPQRYVEQLIAFATS